MGVFFTTAEYGSWTNIFPSPGRWYTGADQSFLSMLSDLFQIYLECHIINVSTMRYFDASVFPIPKFFDWVKFIHQKMFSMELKGK